MSNIDNCWFRNEKDVSNESFVLNKSDQFALADPSKLPNKFADFSEYLWVFLEILSSNIFIFRLGQEGANENELFEKWCHSRVELIDSVSGLYEDCVAFLDLVIDHGYEVSFF